MLSKNAVDRLYDDVESCMDTYLKYQLLVIVNNLKMVLWMTPSQVGYRKNLEFYLYCLFIQTNENYAKNHR
jgi:hypothetical protein